MIISAATPEGARAKIFYANGEPCQLLIARFDTETKETTYYETHLKDGKIQITMTPWEKDEATGRMVRKPLLKTEVLDLYAEIDGKRV